MYVSVTIIRFHTAEREVGDSPPNFRFPFPPLLDFRQKLLQQAISYKSIILGSHKPLEATSERGPKFNEEAYQQLCVLQDRFSPSLIKNPEQNPDYFRYLPLNTSLGDIS